MRDGEPAAPSLLPRFSAHLVPLTALLVRGIPPRHQIHRDTGEITTTKKTHRLLLTCAFSDNKSEHIEIERVPVFFFFFLRVGGGGGGGPSPHSLHFSPTWKKEGEKKKFDSLPAAQLLSSRLKATIKYKVQ